MYPQRCEHQRILGMVQLREPIVIVPFQASIAPPRSSHNVLSLRLMILSRPQSAHLQDHVDTCNANHVSHPRLYCGICRPLPKVSDRSSCNHSVDSCRSKQIGEGCLNLSSCVFPPPLPSPVKTKVQSRFPLLCSTIPPSWSYFWLSHLSSYSASYCRSFYLSNIPRRGPSQILQADRLQLPARLCHN